MKSTPGYQVTKYDTDVLGHILGGMIDEVSTVGLPSDARPWEWIAGANVLSR